MKTIKTQNAVGTVLAHDLTQIIPGEFKGARFKKGHIIQKEDIPVLLSMGKENLYVLELSNGELHENDGAEILKKVCLNTNMEATEVNEGKIEIKSQADGVFTVDRKKLLEINKLSKVIIATLPSFYPVKKGQKLAGMRVIPLTIQKSLMDTVQNIASGGPILKIYPYKLKTLDIIVTGEEVKKGLIEDKFSQVVSSKFKQYGVKTGNVLKAGDDSALITKTIKESKADIVVCTGGMSVDPDDRTPKAISDTRADIVSYGAPVLPGAMFLVSYLQNKPVLGLPGCVMYAKTTILDILLPRIVADIKISKEDIYSLGEGGLCLSCATCTYPKCFYGCGVK